MLVLKKVARYSLMALPWVAITQMPQAAVRPMEPTMDFKMKVGLAAWRKPGARDGRACFQCHGPDGFEIAAYNFDDATILRRASTHAELDQSKEIVGLIHAVREKYQLRTLLDPMKDRPLQPTGKVQPGNTPAERDAAFGQELSTKIPLLFGKPILTVAEAKAAAAQVLKINQWELTYGIPLSRISEDKFHGNEHATLAHWLADSTIKFPVADLPNILAAQDAYLTDPTDANFWKQYELTRSAINGPLRSSIDELSRAKYSSTQILQHLLRAKALGRPMPSEQVAFSKVKRPLIPNPFWTVGDLARNLVNTMPEDLGMDAALRASKSGGPDMETQMGDLTVSWLFLGWLFDQSLFRTTFEKAGRRGDWLQFALWDHGPYPMHNVFSSLRRQLVTSYNPEGWNGDPKRQHFFFDHAQLRIGQKHVMYEPTEAKARDLYRTFTANTFRLSLLLELDDMKKTGIVWGRDPVKQHSKRMAEYVNSVQPQYAAQTNQLLADIYSQVTLSNERILN